MAMSVVATPTPSTPSGINAVWDLTPLRPRVGFAVRPALRHRILVASLHSRSQVAPAELGRNLRFFRNYRNTSISSADIRRVSFALGPFLFLRSVGIRPGLMAGLTTLTPQVTTLFSLCILALWPMPAAATPVDTMAHLRNFQPPSFRPISLHIHTYPHPVLNYDFLKKDVINVLILFLQNMP